MANLHYDRTIPVNFNDLQLEQQKTLKWVGSNKNVLEIGCHTGYLSCWLQKQGNAVTGIEYNELALEKAKPYLSNSIHGDIEQENTWNALGTQKFDIILIMHVLEHLVNPWAILSKTKEILATNGEVIIALPNISNFDTRWEIAKGNFNYTDVGVMDKTHLRFFNQRTARELIIGADYQIMEYSCPWQASIFSKMKFLWRIGDIGFKFTHWLSPNLSDIIMMFKIKPL